MDSVLTSELTRDTNIVWFFAWTADSRTKSLDPVLRHPLHGEFLALFGTVEKIKVDQLLVGNASLITWTEEGTMYRAPTKKLEWRAEARRYVGLTLVESNRMN